MTPDILRAELAVRGITEYETMAGWLPLATFNPYGIDQFDGNGTPGRNYWSKGTRYQGEIVTLDDGRMAVRDVPSSPVSSPFVLGCFPVR